MTLNWKDGRSRSNAVCAIRKLDGVLGLSPRGGVTLGDGGEFDTAVGVLADSLSFDREIRYGRRLSLTRKAVVDAKKASSVTPDTILENALGEQEDYLKQPLVPFVLLTTVSVKYFGALAPVRFEKAQITFSRHKPPRFMLPCRDHAVSLDRNRSPAFSTVRVHIKQRDPYSAGEAAIERLDAFRGLWNLALNRGRTRSSFGGSPGPMNKVLLGQLHTLHHTNGDSATEVFWYEPYRPKDPAPVDLSLDYRDLKQAERRLRKGLNRAPFKQALIDLLVRYSRALDEHDPTSAFLKLWSILEDLTGAGKYDEIIRRASFLYRDPSYKRLELDFLRRWRNRLVHDGENTDQASHFLNQLRGYVEFLMGFLVLNSKYFRGLDEFGQFLSLPAEVTHIRHRLKWTELAHDLYRKS